MYDACDVLHASYCSADVANHVLREYGEGSMGKGIRKLAGEMLTIGGQQSYGIGYDAGVSDTYPTAFKDGVVTGSIICVCAVGLIGFGVWCTKKLIEHHNAKKKKINYLPKLQRRCLLMPKNKLDAVNFCKILDMFGEEAARDTLKDVNDGKISEKTIEKYLYDETETKEQYAERLKRE